MMMSANSSNRIVRGDEAKENSKMFMCHPVVKDI